MKVVITGTTGMIGKGVLLECLENSEISEVLSISRRSLEVEHPKLNELIHKDFSEFDSVEKILEGYDACYACMGVSSAGMGEEEYTKLTFDYTMSLARVLYKLNPNMTFIYVSGQGTDSTEKGRMMWARVKGKTENSILSLGFNKAYVFRPGAIIPKKGVEPSSRLYAFLVNNLSWLIKIAKRLVPNSIIDSEQIGQAMIKLSTEDYPRQIIDPKDVIKIVEGEMSL